MPLDQLAALVTVAALAAYALLGGADFGGGVWDMFASGPRAERQRQEIARAIGPIWEANHVCLIFVVVLTFTIFPPVFSAVSSALYVPLSLILVGITARGGAFVFRAYAADVVPARAALSRACTASSPRAARRCRSIVSCPATACSSASASARRTTAAMPRPAAGSFTATGKPAPLSSRT